MIFAIAAAALLQTAAPAPPPPGPPPPPPVPPSAEERALGEQLARVGLLTNLLGAQSAAEAQAVIAAHPELTEAQRARARVASGRILVEVADALVAEEGRAFAGLMTPDQLRAAIAFFESPAGRAYGAAFPAILMAVPWTGPARDLKGYLMRRLCEEAQVCLTAPGGAAAAPGRDGA